jgi:cbb3-type cytochrome oxidase maturation protein
MTALYLLISLSLLVALGFLAAFIWAVRSGQYEDTCTPSLRILGDDPRVAKDGHAPEPPKTGTQHER